MTPTSPSDRASRSLCEAAFVASALVTGTVEFGLLLTGWLATVLLSITPLVVPVLVCFAAAVRAVAVAEARLAAKLLGARVELAPRATASGFWAGGLAVLADRGFWRGQGYLVLRVVVGWPLAVAELSLLASGLGLIGAPIYYSWIPQDAGRNGIDFAVWRADTLPKALLLIPAGLALLALTLFLVHAVATAWRPAIRLLDKGAAPASSEAVRSQRRRALAVHALIFGFVNLLLIVIWASTGRGYFWPEWPLLGLGSILAFHGWVLLVDERPGLRRPNRALALQLGGSAILFALLVGVWACTGAGSFWPAWALLGLAIAAAIHWAALLLRRVDRLETTRAGAVDVQETDLRRIERDLHDGAQARLVALGMSLGRAEQKLDRDPEAARELVGEARVGVEEALRELRGLARGIRPPVLADRGLQAAVDALADGSPLPVSVEADIDSRPASAVETAAYFVVSEALTNAAKHAGATRAGVRLVRRGAVLEVEVTDDGAGGADPAGGGLVGLRQRVEALDGTLAVTSPPGGPTIVRAELPCGS